MSEGGVPEQGYGQSDSPGQSRTLDDIALQDRQAEARLMRENNLTIPSHGVREDERETHFQLPREWRMSTPPAPSAGGDDPGGDIEEGRAAGAAGEAGGGCAESDANAWSNLFTSPAGTRLQVESRSRRRSTKYLDEPESNGTAEDEARRPLSLNMAEYTVPSYATEGMPGADELRQRIKTMRDEERAHAEEDAGLGGHHHDRGLRSSRQAFHDEHLSRVADYLRECDLLGDAIADKANVRRHLKETLGKAWSELLGHQRAQEGRSRMQALRQAYLNRGYLTQRRRGLLGVPSPKQANIDETAHSNELSKEEDVMAQRKRRRKNNIIAMVQALIVMSVYLTLIILSRNVNPHEEPIAHAVIIGPEANGTTPVNPNSASVVEAKVTVPSIPSKGEHTSVASVSRLQERAAEKRLHPPPGGGRSSLMRPSVQAKSLDSDKEWELSVFLEQRDSDGSWQRVGSKETLELRDQASERTVKFKRPDFNGGGDARLVARALWDEGQPVVAEVKVHTFGPLGLHKEWISAVILIGTLALIAFEIVDRVLAALLGATVMLGLLALLGLAPTFETIITFIDVGALGLLFGMMILVGLLGSTGFFDVATLWILDRTGGSKCKLMIYISLATAFFSMWLDNVTTVLLVAPVTLTIGEKIGMDPRSLLMSMTLFSNIGGAATMVGDPPNIIIGNALQEFIGFIDFLNALLPPVVAVSIMASFALPYIYRDSLRNNFDLAEVKKKAGSAVITDERLLIKSLIVIGFVILAFLINPVTNTNVALIAIFGAIALLLLAKPGNVEPGLESVEWSTLTFFAGLFVMVEAIREAGLIDAIGALPLPTRLALSPYALKPPHNNDLCLQRTL